MIGISYVHRDQFYLGGLLKRAGQRLGVSMFSIGPKEGSWIEAAPTEPDNAPDLLVEDRKPFTLPSEVDEKIDALINVCQGDNFYCISKKPTVHVFTEGNPGEYDDARACNAKAVWSCMPRKETGLLQSGLWYLQWGYDPEYTPMTPPGTERPVDFGFYGSTGYEHRKKMFPDWARENDLVVHTGPPMSRSAWGANLRMTKTTFHDHWVNVLSGRIVDAVASGVLMMSIPQPVMDVLLPRGYVRLKTFHEVPGVVRAFKAIENRGPIVEQAQRAIAGLSWDDQFVRILGSIGVQA